MQFNQILNTVAPNTNSQGSSKVISINLDYYTYQPSNTHIKDPKTSKYDYRQQSLKFSNVQALH